MRTAAGRYAVWVDENFRVVFRFEAGDAVEVDYADLWVASRKKPPNVKSLRQAA
jgi:hypothetical protein